MHVRYTDFIADPVGTMRGYYDVLRADADCRGRGGDARLPGEQPGDRHGKFRYSTRLLTDIGEDLDALHEEFRPFRERFGVEIEKRGLRRVRCTSGCRCTV